MSEWEVAYDGVMIAGLKYRLVGALEFLDEYCDGLPAEIRLEPEPDNDHDENAVKVVGHSPCGERQLGYLPAPLAETIAYKKMQMNLKAEIVEIKVDEVTAKVAVEIRVLTRI